MIVNAQGKPYSKRDGDAYVGEFREKGYLADALFNYLVLLDGRRAMTGKCWPATS
jgi:glutamyl/glutaminyl-tRNA synthetase